MNNNGVCSICGYQQDGNRLSNALAVGHRLCNGRYRIVRVLGEGGYGITYAVSDKSNGQMMAMKEFFPAFALNRSPNGRDVVCKTPKDISVVNHAKVRFFQEARLLTNLKDVREIVTVNHFFEENNTAYYTMELLQGRDMQYRLRTNGTMIWSEVRPIVISVLRALYVTHRSGYIHRDVTPDNIYLLDDGTVKLIDFGNARQYESNEPMTAVVKEKFAPQEQYRSGSHQGPWTDVYSICVTIYYALTGVLPPKATERMQRDVPLLPLHQVCADVPPEVGKAVAKGMTVQEIGRYQTIADLAYAMFPQQTILSGLVQPVGSHQMQSVSVGAQRAAQEPNAGVHGGGRKIHFSLPFFTRPVSHEMQYRPKPQMQQPPIQQVGMQGSTLCCVQGVFGGRQFPLTIGQTVSFGRGMDCTVIYPEHTNGISRNQCSIFQSPNGMIYIRDDGSRFGTFVNGVRLVPNVGRVLRAGDAVVFGHEMYVLR